jgi:hypothetical protein
MSRVAQYLDVAGNCAKGNPITVTDRGGSRCVAHSWYERRTAGHADPERPAGSALDLMEPGRPVLSEVKRFTRIVTDAAGGTTFRDDEFLLDASQGAAGMFTGTVPGASAVVYVRHDTWDNFAHPTPRPAPRQQWVVVLRGAVEVEVTDGSRRTFGPGDLLRAEDTEGTGHVTKPIGDPPVEAFFLPC